MQRFFYIGEYPDGKSDMLAYGNYLFAPGVSVELPEPFATKARGNRFFVAAEPIADVTVVVAPEQVAAPPAEPATDDEVPEFSKQDLIDMADKAGVKVDRRWSAERIRAAIMNAASQIED